MSDDVLLGIAHTASVVAGAALLGVVFFGLSTLFRRY